MTLRVGIAGLGAPSVQILRGFAGVDGVALAAAADLRQEARAEFTRTYDLPAFDSVEAMARSASVDAVWVATPSQLHCAHTLAAAEHGKHVICEKPLALSLEDCDRMIAAADRARVQLVLGHSKIFDTPIRAIGRIVAGGSIGAVVQIDSWLFNDWLQRPRLAAELDSSLGGGVVLRQGPHQVDIVRHIAGGLGRELRATAGCWDPHFPTEGNYACLLEFENGAVANFSCNGYGYFDVRELTWGIGVVGRQENDPRSARRRRRTGPLSVDEKYGAAASDSPARAEGRGTFMPFFGLTIVSCERGVIRQSPTGLYLSTEQGCEEIAVEPSLGQAAELIELRDAVAEGRPAFPDGRWGRATVEVCLAMLRSAREHRAVPLARQVARS
ncbi:MAG TPA: Gfo/Idh/MocA family oxidoreductase [Stellaceae bacterium]|nr:Gfo/Idh/MocA family oxidoreductase [Stellaceae bacterium]